MKRTLNVIAFASLALLTAPSFLFLSGKMSLPAVKLLMLIATVAWFACTVTSMWNKKEDSRP